VQPDQHVVRVVLLDFHEVAVIDDAPDDIAMSYGLLGFSGTAESSSMSLRFGSSLLGTNGGSSILFDG